MEKDRWSPVVRNIMEGQGYSLAQWGLTPYPSNYIFQSIKNDAGVFGIIEEFGGEQFDSEITKLYADVMSSSDPNDYKARLNICKRLGEKSRAALEKITEI